MKLLRLLPEHIPEKRNYVIDQLDTMTIWNYDMSPVADLNDDVILLEWDMAVAYHDLVNFIIHARSAPHLVHVAPYVLYPVSTDLVTPVWAHREMVREIPLQLNWIDYGEPVCDIFSTGMVYLPGDVLKEASNTETISWQPNLTDSKLAFWYYYNIGKKIPVHWDVRPIHLHYSVERIYDEPDVEHLVRERI